MRRRRFSVLLGAAVAGLVSGSRAPARENPRDESKPPKHGCAGRNSCKSKGGCEVPLKIEHAKARAPGPRP